MGAEAGGSDVGRLRVDGTQAPQATPHRRRAPEQSMARCVRLLTDPASGSQDTSRRCTAHIQASVDGRSGEGTATSSSSGRPGAGVCPPRRGDPLLRPGPVVGSP